MRGADRLVELLERSRDMLIFTGAGISTGSGIADFRGPQGVWRTRQPVYLQDFMASDAARVEYWDQKLEAWPSFKAAQPNAAHAAIASLENAGKVSMVVTQNIDGLHARAGTSAEKLVELHGTNLEVQCMSCNERTDPEPHFQSFSASSEPPVCNCGGYLKPATISFGQSLRPEDLMKAGEAASEADLVVALGSTLSVYPAAAFPLQAAERGAPYVIINRGETDHDAHVAVTLRLEGDVVEIFPRAVGEALGA